MSKICKKKVHGNDKKNLPWDFKKCPGSLHYTLLSSGYQYIVKIHLMENYLQNNVSGFISRDPAKLLLLLWLFWIILSELQKKFTSEIALNDVNRYVSVKCKYLEHYLLGNCLCPTIDGNSKHFHVIVIPIREVKSMKAIFVIAWIVQHKPIISTAHVNHQSNR